MQIVIPTPPGTKPKRKRRTRAQIEATEAQGRLDRLLTHAAQIAAPIVKNATRGQKWVAGRIIRRTLNTGAGRGAANVRPPK